METFIGVKLVEAKPMTRGEYNMYQGWLMPPNENRADEGYLVKYSDDYISWCPKDNFDNQNLSLTGNNNTVTQEDVDNFIGSLDISTLMVEGVAKSTLVTVALKNGFVIHETSSCVDPANYDEQVGADICLAKIKDQVWYLLGFLLQSGINGFKGGE